MNKLILLILIILGISCSDNQVDVDRQQHENELKFLSRHLDYYKDVRTNLCFAWVGGLYSSSLVCVSCTPEIEKIAYHLPYSDK